MGRITRAQPRHTVNRPAHCGHYVRFGLTRHNPREREAGPWARTHSRGAHNTWHRCIEHSRDDLSGVAGPGEGLELKLHEATAHQPGNERSTGSKWLGMATLTSGNGWCSGGGQRRSQGGAWLGLAQQWLHQEHATTQEGRRAPAERWLTEEDGWSLAW
jgi:hypothetical protein